MPSAYHVDDGRDEPDHANDGHENEHALDWLRRCRPATNSPPLNSEWAVSFRHIAGAAFRSLGDPLFDTTSSQGRLVSTLLAAIAEFERELIKERTGDGRRRAMAKGIKFGRKPKLSDYQRQEAIRRRAESETLASIAKSYAVDVSMISRL